ncbi:MAG TPA: PD-(D/E)XK nuclease family protein, partial [Gammaproteobacteria bacterium]|nr:PD-(D/E)XK nuclease family protein [Gammaproteobacteria bacterium]
EPQALIGCIAAQLEDKRDDFIAVFTDIFGSQEKFNISAGKTLTAYPIIQFALQLLSLSPQQINIETLSPLLHSPFIGNAESEMLKRIQYDSQLRRSNITQISLSTLLRDCPPRLAELIRKYIAKRENEPNSCSLSRWIFHFSSLLEAFGWPGEQSLNSSEYQVVKEWMDLLKEAARLEHVLAPVSYNQALHYLTVLAARTYFQPQSPEAPVQILGQLEGAGIPFDYLWVMGMDDTAWPPAPSPNPFIPQLLQKQFQMPNATAERQLAYSLKLTEQFTHSAPTVVFSHVKYRGEEELLPSPLITKLENKELEYASFKPSTKCLFESQDLETIQDDQAPPLLGDEKIRGGTSIFEMQAACSFKAFAKLRLNARALDETQTGLPATSKGNIIHRVLELFWRDIGDQQSLLQLSDTELQKIIDQHLTSALHEIAPFIPSDSFFYSLITERLKLLLKNWLVLEKSRPPFRVIALEEEKTIEIANLPIKIRVDRMDEIANGQKLIIDYKTKKKCDVKAWFTERPDEPQLPLYCITDKDNTAGIAFAQLHMIETGLRGIAKHDLSIEGITEISEKLKCDAASWEEQLEKWRISLTQLIHDFQSGLA